MNDFQMTSLANDRSKQLMAEADQHRLARQAKQPARHQELAPRRGFVVGRLLSSLTELMPRWNRSYSTEWDAGIHRRDRWSR